MKPKYLRSRHLWENALHKNDSKTVSKFIFFNLFAVFFNLFVAFFNLFETLFNLFVPLFNLSSTFLNLFASLFNLFAAFFNLFVPFLNLSVVFFSVFALSLKSLIGDKNGGCPKSHHEVPKKATSRLFRHPLSRATVIRAFCSPRPVHFARSHDDSPGPDPL